MRLQTIQSLEGRDEYILLPMNVYQVLKDEIAEAMEALRGNDDYVPFELEDYVDNPVALARIRARVSQAELAGRLGVSQPYISKVERQDCVTPRLLERVTVALSQAE